MKMYFSHVRSRLARTILVVAPFLVTAACENTTEPEAGTGSLLVATSTTGSDVDPDGYTVVVDGELTEPIQATGSATLSSLEPGSHSVQLDGVAENCSVSGENPRSVQVNEGETSNTIFQVSCLPPTGDARVTTETTGSDLDPDGYTVTLDPGTEDAESRSIGVSDAVTFAGLSTGEHTLEISGVANNCMVAENPRTVDVPQGGTATASFEVSCSSTTGDLEVSTSTSGSDLDPDGYTVVVDGSQSQGIGTDATVTFSGVAADDHQVELQGLAANCTASDNPRTVTVPGGGTATTVFDVTCGAALGDLEVSTSTTGEDLDPDGYTVAVDPGTPDELIKSIGANATVTFSNLDEGDHELELGGLATNCTAADNPRTVTIPNGGTAMADFDVTCFNALIVFEAQPDGEDWDIYVMNADGSGQTSLTNNSVDDRLPAWSPDKSQIAFVRDQDIWVMNADGSNPVNLTTDLAGNLTIPDFSPDGTKIAFTQVSGGVGDIWVMDADGSNKTNITNSASDDRHARWSPDGTKFAFRRNGTGETEVFVMDVDGSNRVNLSNSPNTDEGLPAWSPDGTKIAFARHFFGPGGGIADTEIIVMDADGSNQTNLTNMPSESHDGTPSWSPDGSKIAFFSDRDGNQEIYIMNADGTDQTRITFTAGRADRAPAWAAPGGL